MDHVPAAAIAHLTATEGCRELTLLPGPGIAIAGDVFNQPRRNDLRRTAAAAIYHELAEPREIPPRGAETAGTAWCPFPVDGNTGRVFGAHRLPQQFAHQRSKGLAGRAL